MCFSDYESNKSKFVTWTPRLMSFDLWDDSLPIVPSRFNYKKWSWQRSKLCEYESLLRQIDVKLEQSSQRRKHIWRKWGWLFRHWSRTRLDMRFAINVNISRRSNWQISWITTINFRRNNFKGQKDSYRVVVWHIWKIMDNAEVV